MKQHTPAPWGVHKCEPNGNFSVYASGPLAYVEREADACLIAAAPELLAILKKWSLKIDESANDSLVIERIMTVKECREINAAIAKAKGEA